MPEDRIRVGDKVSVYWENPPPIFRGTVLYVPYATGDSWIIKDEDDGLHYVQMFCRMDKHQEPKITKYQEPELYEDTPFGQEAL